MSRWLLCISALLVFMTAVCHGADSPEQNRLKAAYLYNFSKFISWPEDCFKEDQDFVIGVLGSSELVPFLQPLTAETVRNRPIRIEVFDSLEQLQHCQILFLGTDDEDRLRLQLESLADRPIVTVSPMQKSAELGGVIQLVWKRERLAFIVNLKPARNNGIKVKSQLLALALDVLNKD